MLFNLKFLLFNKRVEDSIAIKRLMVLMTGLIYSLVRSLRRLLLFKGKDSNVLTAVNIKSTTPFRFARQRCIRHLVYLPAELVVCISAEIGIK